jgi:methyltransferase (TIGR00027 family)
VSDAKRSAESMAAMRFLGTRERSPEVRNPDRLAGRLLGRRLRLMAGAPGIGAVVRRAVGRRFPGGVEYHIARTRHFDRTLLEALDAGATQVVLLGAGYDTRAYRFAGELAGARVVAVDHPATLEQARERVVRALGPPPVGVAHVAADFDSDDLGAALRSGGYDPARRTLFLWEGVVVYLSEEAVDRLLRLVASDSAPGSSIVFDYAVRAALERPGDFYGGAEAAAYLARSGEPWRFGIEHEEVEPFLRERGLELVSLLTPPELERAYLTRADGSLAGRIPSFHGMAHARVPEPA